MITKQFRTGLNEEETASEIDEWFNRYKQIQVIGYVATEHWIIITINVIN